MTIFSKTVTEPCFHSTSFSTELSCRCWILGLHTVAILDFWHVTLLGYMCNTPNERKFYYKQKCSSDLTRLDKQFLSYLIIFILAVILKCKLSRDQGQIIAFFILNIKVVANVHDWSSSSGVILKTVFFVAFLENDRLQNSVTPGKCPRLNYFSMHFYNSIHTHLIFIKTSTGAKFPFVWYIALRMLLN